jgi:hypothetical protein
MSRNAPMVDEEPIESPAELPAAPPRRTVMVGTIAVFFAAGQIFFPDPEQPPLVFPTPRPVVLEEPQPTAVPSFAIQSIDTTKLNAGIVEKPIPYEWPEVEDLKLVPNPGRPSEQADYTPNLSAVEKRRLIQASSVTVIQHSDPRLAIELSKAFPLRAARQPVLDFSGYAGYLPDEGGFGVAFSYGGWRASVETMLGSPPTSETQRAEIEYHTLHLADHIARRLQEVASGGQRTGPEGTAVHWRDHLIRALPFGR